MVPFKKIILSIINSIFLHLKFLILEIGRFRGESALLDKHQLLFPPIGVTI
jgi:hypothetical protein